MHAAQAEHRFRGFAPRRRSDLRELREVLLSSLPLPGLQLARQLPEHLCRPRLQLLELLRAGSKLLSEPLREPRAAARAAERTRSRCVSPEALPGLLRQRRALPLRELRAARQNAAEAASRRPTGLATARAAARAAARTPPKPLPELLCDPRAASRCATSKPLPEQLLPRLDARVTSYGPDLTSG